MTKRDGGTLEGVPALIVAMPGMRGLCGLFLQSAHEDDKPAIIPDHMSHTLAKFQSIHNHAYGAYLAVSMLLGLDRSIYGKLIENPFKYYSMVTNQYPRTCSNMHDTIFHWRNRSDLYKLSAPPGAVVFAQESENEPANGYTHAANGQKEPHLSKVKCFKDQKNFYLSNNCPNRANTGKTHANVGTKEASNNDMNGLMSTIEIDADADYHFEGFVMVTNG